MAELKRVGIKQAVEIGLANEKMNLTELARATGRELTTLSVILSRGKPSLGNTIGLINGVNAKLVVRYDNGNEVELSAQD